LTGDLLGETFRGMQVSEEEIKEVLAAQEANGSNAVESASKMPEVQPGNLAIVELFFAVGKYWERAGMEATRLCLDPLKVEARASKLRWYKSLDDEAIELIWQGLDIMESACLTTWSEHKKNNE